MIVGNSFKNLAYHAFLNVHFLLPLTHKLCLKSCNQKVTRNIRLGFPPNDVSKGDPGVTSEMSPMIFEFLNQ